ncbi:MAG: protein kinase [Polyangiaceae bacterium]|nr:protein kinase [Polyangiaceae bacterium]
MTPTIRLSRPLGQGGMGSVWVAHHAALDTEVAVKFISPEALKAEPSLAERFTREARLAAKIRDPHVVQILDHGVTADGTPFIAMEMLEGMSLARLLERQGPLTPTAAAMLVTQTAGALGKAHKLGIVHRDIKPDNLFLTTAAGTVFVKILDFGIAKGQQAAVSSLTATGSVFGTPQYMSPEQLLSAKDVDALADLWALAVVAYETLTGRPPFQGETMAALTLAICNASFEPARAHDPELPLEVDHWFSRALARQPEDRFQTARELATTFAEACSGSVPASTAQALESLPTAHAARSATAPAVAPGPVVTMSGASTSRAATAGERPKSAVPWVLGTLVAVAILAVVLSRIGTSSSDAVSSPITSAAPASPGATTEVAPTVPTTSSPPNVDTAATTSALPATPRAAASGSSSGPATGSAAPSTAPQAPPPTAAKSSAPAVSVPRVASPPPQLPPADCSTPFYVDAQGIKRVRKECL